MTGRRLHFVDRAIDAPPAEPSTDIVVLDTAWTPSAADRPDLRPIRETLHGVLARAELHEELERCLDGWADAIGAVDRFKIGTVSCSAPGRRAAAARAVRTAQPTKGMPATVRRFLSGIRRLPPRAGIRKRIGSRTSTGDRTR
jgi:hypothetical protein